MKKSQFIGKPFIYALILIFAILLLLWANTQFRDVGEKTKRGEVKNFVISLNNLLLVQTYKYEGVKERSFALPIDVELVCFVDKNKEIDQYVNTELSSYLEIYPDYNIFFFPIDKYDPENIKNMELDELENPLCVKNVNEKISLSLVGKGDRTLIKAINYSEKDVDCVTVLYNGDPDNKVDVVFLGNEYKDLEDFVKDTNNYINNVFLGTRPFELNKKKINFYRIDKFQDLGCKITSYILCNQYKAKQLASNCPNDYIFIITDIGKIKDFVKPIRSSAFSNIAHVNAADNEFVLLHEFGHTFADLADEYVDESYYKQFDEESYPNCDKAGCGEWSSIAETGCFKGCSVSQFYRSTKESIMRNYLKSPLYGPVSEDVINRKLGVYE